MWQLSKCNYPDSIIPSTSLVTILLWRDGLSSLCLFIYTLVSLDSRDSYFIPVRLYSLVSVYWQPRVRTSTFNSRLLLTVPVPHPAQAARHLAPSVHRFLPGRALGRHHAPSPAASALLHSPRWSLVPPLSARSRPLELLTSFERLFRMPLAGSCCVWGQCFWLGSEHLCCLGGVCVCTFVSALLRVHGILWLMRVAGFGAVWLAPVSLLCLAPHAGPFLPRSVCSFLSSCCSLCDLQPRCALHSVLITVSSALLDLLLGLYFLYLRF